MNTVENPDRTNPAVVLGLNPNGLGIVRSLHAAQIPVIGVDREPQGLWDTNIWMSSHTRLCKKYFYNASEQDGLLAGLLSLGKTLHSKGVLLPSADPDLLCMSRHRKALADFYLFSVPDANTVELLADKGRFYDFATDNNIPAPLTFVSPSSDDVEDIAHRMRYPCLLKPHIRDGSWNVKFSNRKVLVAENAQQLIEQFHIAYPEHRRLLIQEIIPGPDSNLYFSHVYMSERLEPLALWTGRKIRQRPIHFGTSTMTETVWVDAIAEASVALLRQLKCVGYSSIEFKKDDRDGQYKIMEVTQGRTWYPHYLGFGAGVNIPHVWYCDLTGITPPPRSRAKEGVRWIDECRDPAASFDYWRHSELTVMDWLRSHMRVRVFAFASLRDPMPLVLVFLRLILEPLRILTRLLRRFVRSGR